ESIAKRRFRTKKFVQKESAFVRAKRFLVKGFVYSFITIFTVAVFSGIGFFYYYNHYSQIVEQRVASGFWHTRAGIYAAPHVLRNDQKISQAETVELLRRSGYVENDSAESIWNGSFSMDGNVVSIKDNSYYSTKTKDVNIKFDDGKIVSITDQASPLEQFEIQPELLSGRSEAKRGVNRVLKYEQIPEVLRNAILSAEDQRFFFHPGIDVKSIGRAFYVNLTGNEIKQGASTITQQLVKNTFLTPEKTFTRKFSEAFLSLALERQMSKEDIFALYCNEIYLGQYGAVGIHGVEQAARVYFDKDLKDLNLTEAAAIAAMIKNPTYYAPHKSDAQAKTRREWIISKMQEAGLVSGDQVNNALKTEIVLAKPKSSEATIAPYFVDAATKRLTEMFSENIYNTNFNRRVYTTIDTQLQQIAEQAVSDQIAKLDKIYNKKGKTIQATLVSIDPHTGQILALVGGRNYRESQFNRATEAKRQPGSVFKPFIYATALERGMTPMHTVVDSKTEFTFDNGKPYIPANYGGSYSNDTITMKTALAKSSNVVAVKTAMDTGLKNVARKAEEFGFENIEAYPSMALGTMEVTPLQLAAAYAVFANGGRQVEPTFVSKIISGEDKIIYESTASEKQIVSPKTAYMITDMLEAVVTRGTARAAKNSLGKNVVFAGKTGSSKDGWFVGYTPNLVTVAWIGFDETEDIGMTGGEAALPLWTEFMRQAVSVRPELGGAGFEKPKGVVTIEIDPATGMLADKYCPYRETVVVPASSSANIHCLKHQPQTTDTLVAVNDENIETLPETTIITPENVTVERQNETTVQYEKTEVKSLPEREIKPEKIDMKEPVEKNKVYKESKTYLERFEMQDKKKVKTTGLN
ncbi:MAG: transglycosylase domain-containing protein, partial [Pyrinomonadaceae bacterium]